LARRILGIGLVTLFAAWAVAALLGLMGQRKLFYEEGKEELYDFWMPRMCIEQGYIGHPERFAGLVDVRNRRPIEISRGDVEWSDWYTDGERTLFVTGWRDKVYPVFAVLPMKMFPASRFGGYLWSALAGIVLIASMCMIARSWWPVLLALSMPFLFNVERGNPVWISAACAGIFLAWWDDEKEWKRLVAAACLAVAGAMKIAPFALGAVYLTKWRWRPVILCGVLSLAFVFVPWLFVSDGFAALPVMFRNASEHAKYVQRASDFGLVQLWRTVRIVQGAYVHEIWPGMKAVAIASQLIGACVLIVGARRRDNLLLVGGMMWAAGNMYYYAMLYLLPVLALEVMHDDGRSWGAWRWIRAGVWLALLSPLQLIVLGHSANQVIGNVMLMMLVALTMLEHRRQL